MRHQYLLCSKHVKSLLKAIRAHPVYFEAQLQTESKPDNFLAFSTAISYHFYISFELQLDKTKAKRQITDCSCLRITTFASSVCDSCLVPWLQQFVLSNSRKKKIQIIDKIESPVSFPFHYISWVCGRGRLRYFMRLHEVVKASLVADS